MLKNKSVWRALTCIASTWAWWDSTLFIHIVDCMWLLLFHVGAQGQVVSSSSCFQGVEFGRFPSAPVEPSGRDTCLWPASFTSGKFDIANCPWLLYQTAVDIVPCSSQQAFAAMRLKKTMVPESHAKRLLLMQKYRHFAHAVLSKHQSSIHVPWAAQYNSWLLIKLTPKGVLFSFLQYMLHPFCHTAEVYRASSPCFTCT